MKRARTEESGTSPLAEESSSEMASPDADGGAEAEDEQEPEDDDDDDDDDAVSEQSDGVLDEIED